MKVTTSHFSTIAPFAIAAAVTPDTLRELRRAAGLTQAELAKLLGLDRTTITRAERGERRVDMALLTRWAEVCGSTVDLAHSTSAAGLDEVLATQLEALTTDDVALVRSIVTLLPTLSDDNRRTLASLVRAWSVKEL